MQISLNRAVELLSSLVGQPFSIPIQEQLKVILNYKFADYIQKIVDKHPEQRRFYLKDFSVALERVDRAQCPVEVGCTVLRTVEDIPIPVRTSYALFDYIGSPDKVDGYRYIEPDQLVYIINYSKYTGDRPSYFYVNKRIYIYNEDDLDDINVRGLWPDQRQLNVFKCEDQPCYTDNSQYDIPDDILNTMIQDVIKNELKLLLPPDETEVTLKEEN